MNPQTHSELGRLLKNARLDRRLELPHISRLTYIRQRYLEALEEGVLEELPGATYVKGYLHQYAQFLGLAADEVVAAYEHIGAVRERRFFHIPETIRKEEKPGQVLVGVTLGLAIVLVAWIHSMLAPGTSSSAVPALAARAPETAAAQIIRAPACLSRLVPDWPPCYYMELPVASALVLHAIPAQVRL